MCTFLPRGLPLNNFFRNEMSILETSGSFYPQSSGLSFLATGYVVVTWKVFCLDLFCF